MTPLPRPTIDAIYALHEARERASAPRPYLGGSEIGGECSRAIWYRFRHASREPVEGRALRLFETGHLAEARLIEELRAIGCEVLDRDPSTGEQWRYTEGHLSGGLDGVMRGLKEAPETWHLLEIKTANKKSFDDLEKKGVREWRPKYWTQAQLYMSMAGLTRCAFFVVCKDDERLYLERIEASEKEAKAARLKARRIIEADSAPERISDDPSFYKCKFCPSEGLCRGSAMPLVSCRTCVHSSAEESGGWMCALGRGMNPGCQEHVFLPSLLVWAEPIDGAPDWIKYRRLRDGREFVNATRSSFPAQAAPHYSSAELAAMLPETVAAPAIDKAREVMGGTVVETRSLFGPHAQKEEPGL